MENNNLKFYVKGAIFGIIITTTLFLSYIFFNYKEYMMASKIINIVKNFSLYTVNDKDIYESMYAGILSGIKDDKYAEYYGAQDLEKLKEITEGNYEGIGISLMYDEDLAAYIVFGIMDNSPAKKKGIKIGDVVLKVDSKSVEDMSFEEVIMLIKGKAKTVVNLEILRENKIEKYSITRESVEINTVEYNKINDSIAYFKIFTFDENTGAEFIEKYNELDDSVKNIIIDVRNNPGGVVSSALEISDVFLKDGEVIVYTENNRGEKEYSYATNGSDNKNIFIIANENSASASEILIGALKDNKKATIFGQKTYGKGVIQSVVNLDDFSSIKFTTAKYYSPNGNVIDKNGIEPNIELKVNDINRTFDVITHREKDTEVKEVIKYINEKSL